MADSIKRKLEWGFIFPAILVVTTAVVAFFSFRYPYSFNYELDINDQYYLALLWPVVACIIVVSLTGDNFRVTLPRLFYLLLVVIISVFTYVSHYYHWGNEHYFVVASVVIVAGTIFFVRDMGVINVILSLLVLLQIVELYIGCQQYLDAKDYSLNLSLEITGTFQNSGVFSMYLVSQLPVLYYVVRQLGADSSRVSYSLFPAIRFWVFAVLCLLSCFLVYQSQSRSALLSIVVIMLACTTLKYGWYMKLYFTRISRPVKIILLSVITVLLLCGGYYLFLIKKMSALGRVMKLCIAWDHITDNFWLGTGLGRFSWYYPQWQATWFKEHINPPKYFLMGAGESYLLFNEPVQLFKEIGFMGFSLVVTVLYFFYKARSVQSSNLFTSLKLVVTGIIVCSFTSYPLHVNYMLWLLLFCIFTVITLADYKTGAWTKIGTAPRTKMLLLLPSLLLAIVSVKGIVQYTAFVKWKNGMEYSGFGKNTVSGYDELEPLLGQNGKFLTAYGAVLLGEGKAERAVLKLEQAQTFFVSRKTADLLAAAYAESGSLKKAVERRQWLCYYLPNKFTCKGELLQLYQKTADTANATSIAKDILAMPVKVPSGEVDRVKYEARDFLSGTMVRGAVK